MKKLYTPSPKNLVNEFGSTNPAVVSAMYQQQGSTPQPVTPNHAAPTVQVQNVPGCRLTTMEGNMASQDHRLARLENCCSQLAETTQGLVTQISLMNENVNRKFHEMSLTINQVVTSPSHGRSAKLHKNNSQMETDF